MGALSESSYTLTTKTTNEGQGECGLGMRLAPCMLLRALWTEVQGRAQQAVVEPPRLYSGDRLGRAHTRVCVCAHTRV